MGWGDEKGPTPEQKRIRALEEALTTAVALAAKHSDLWTKEDYVRLREVEEVLDGTCSTCSGKTKVPGMVMLNERHGAGWGEVPCPACTGKVVFRCNVVGHEQGVAHLHAVLDRSKETSGRPTV